MEKENEIQTANEVKVSSSDPPIYFKLQFCLEV